MDSDFQHAHWKKNLIGVWISQILCMAGFSSIMPFIPLFIRDKYNITDERELGMWVATLTFFSFCSYTVATPIWGMAADKFGRKLMLLRAHYLAALLFPLMYFAPYLSTSVALLVGVRTFVSLFSGVTNSAQTLVISTTPKEHHGVALGTLSTAIWSGNMIGFLAGALFVNAFGYFWGFMCCGAMFLVGGVVVHIVVRENFVPPVKQAKGNAFAAFFRELTSATVLMLALFFAMGMARRLDEPYIALLVSQLANPDKAIFFTGLISLVAALGGMFSGIVTGKLCDRFDPVKVSIPAVLFAAMTMILQALSINLWMLGGARFIHFTAAGGLEPAFLTMLARIVPEEKQGTIFGIASSVRFFGILSSALLSGTIIWIFGNVRAVFFGSSILFLLLLPLILLAAANIKKINLKKEATL